MARPTVSSTSLAAIFGTSVRSVTELAVAGIIKREADGKFDRDDSTRLYCAHLRGVASGRAASEATAEAKAKSLEAGAALKRKQEALTELRLEKERG